MNIEGNPTLHGIDVSIYQGWINWQQVRNAGKSFALVKATEGTGYVDRYFVRNWHVSKQRGLLRGAYHFADLLDPEAEANHFAAMAGPLLARGDWAMLDLETPGYEVAGWALTWLETVTRICGVKPVLYSYLSYFQSYLQDERLADYAIIVADYAGDPPPIPSPWPIITGWQYSDSGRVSGIAGDVDLDVFYGSADTWAKLGKQ